MNIEERNYVQEVIDRLIAERPSLDSELVPLYALLVLVKGTDTTLRDVHDAWAIWKASRVRDHASLVPFEQLSNEVQELDRPFMNDIHCVARGRLLASIKKVNEYRVK